jgi:outer membrane immunogenic protein
MKKFLLGTLGLVAMVAPAVAADLPVRAPPPMIPPMFNWSGFYIGGNGGWGRTDDCWDLFAPVGGGALELVGIDGCHDRSGGVIGGQIGYRWQLPGSHFVWGFEAQGDWANLSGSRVSVFNPALALTAKVDAIGLFTYQFGFAWDTWLWYAKGGFAVTDNNFALTDTGFGVVSASSTRWGGVVGTGVEYAFTPNWSVGFEYDHLFMGARDTIFPGIVAPALVGSVSRVDQAVDMVTVRFNYRFGGYGYGGPLVARY